jgi:hypothetical protein
MVVQAIEFGARARGDKMTDMIERVARAMLANSPRHIYADLNDFMGQAIIEGNLHADSSRISRRLRAEKLLIGAVTGSEDSQLQAS